MAIQRKVKGLPLSSPMKTVHARSSFHQRRRRKFPQSIYVYQRCLLLTSLGLCSLCLIENRTAPLLRKLCLSSTMKYSVASPRGVPRCFWRSTRVSPLSFSLACTGDVGAGRSSRGGGRFGTATAHIVPRVGLSSPGALLADCRLSREVIAARPTPPTGPLTLAR